MITGKLFAEAVGLLVESLTELARSDEAMGSGESAVQARAKYLHDDMYDIWLEGVPDNQQNRLTISPGPEVEYSTCTFRMVFAQCANPPLYTLLPMIPRILYAILAYS